MVAPPPIKGGPVCLPATGRAAEVTRVPLHSLCDYRITSKWQWHRFSMDCELTFSNYSLRLFPCQFGYLDMHPHLGRIAREIGREGFVGLQLGGTSGFNRAIRSQSVVVVGLEVEVVGYSVARTQFANKWLWSSSIFMYIALIRQPAMSDGEAALLSVFYAIEQGAHQFNALRPETSTRGTMPRDEQTQQYVALKACRCHGAILRDDSVVSLCQSQFR